MSGGDSGGGNRLLQLSKKRGLGYRADNLQLLRWHTAEGDASYAIYVQIGRSSPDAAPLYF